MVHVRIKNTSKSPFTIKKNITRSEFRIVTPRRQNTEDDSEQTFVYINELSHTNEKPQATTNYWFPTPGNPGNKIIIPRFNKKF